MLESSISDQKRLVRGLHWERTRCLLRARDQAHHQAWRLLTVAGPVPHEEITCIRELMPHAHITSVDIDQHAVLAAMDAGADDAYEIDIGAFQKTYDLRTQRFQYAPPAELNRMFDAVCLDLTATPEKLRGAARTYWHRVSKGGVLMLTFSYGRDVVEMYRVEWENMLGLVPIMLYDKYPFDPETYLDFPLKIAERVWYLFRSPLSRHLDSCMQYCGAHHPVVACLLRKGQLPSSPNFRIVKDGDYEKALTGNADYDLGKVYACPAERVAGLHAFAKSKRSDAAKKAAATTQRLKAQKKQLLLPAPTTLPVPVGPTNGGGWQHGHHIDSLPRERPAEDIRKKGS